MVNIKANAQLGKILLDTKLNTTFFEIKFKAGCFSRTILGLLLNLDSIVLVDETLK